ncbi:MAG: thymidylate synthase (FAD), partial [Firmicutes bacterium]|nr:thymidylate synthase (FAD) [Bacillota bacterium]
MRVQIIAHTPEPEQVVAAAARLCYSQAGAEELLERLSEEEVDRLLSRLEESGHLSPFEHVSFTFSIEGVSRALSHQLVRHRIA